MVHNCLSHLEYHHRRQLPNVYLVCSLRSIVRESLPLTGGSAKKNAAPVVFELTLSEVVQDTASQKQTRVSLRGMKQVQSNSVRP